MKSTTWALILSVLVVTLDLITHAGCRGIYNEHKHSDVRKTLRRKFRGKLVSKFG